MRTMFRIRLSYPVVAEEDVGELSEFMKKAHEYCAKVCRCMVEMYDCPFVPHEEEAEILAERIIDVCRKRFPWIKVSDIESILSIHMAMNR